MAPKRPGAPNELFPTIYGELRRVARRYLGHERQNHTLQPTALVHEAWVRLQNDRGAEWQGKTHGLALGAQAMRRVLVDHGRHQKREKRGGGVQPVVLDDLLQAAATRAVPVEDLLTLEAALSRLEAIDPRAAQVVILRFFSGMTSVVETRSGRSAAHSFRQVSPFPPTFSEPAAGNSAGRRVTSQQMEPVARKRDRHC